MRDTLVYYHLDNLEAIRVGNGNCILRKGDQEINDLYDLEADIGEIEQCLQ